MKMRGRRLHLHPRTVCTCCNGVDTFTRTQEKREARREIEAERD